MGKQACYCSILQVSVPASLLFSRPGLRQKVPEKGKCILILIEPLYSIAYFIVTRGLVLALIRFCGIGQRLLYNVSAGRFSPFIVGYQILASSSAGASAITLLLEKSLTFLVII